MKKEKYIHVIQIIVGLAVAIGACFYLRQEFVSSQRTSNERAASIALKQLTAAEALFRTKDLDGNGIDDFWTGDVAGLYSILTKTSRDSSEIRLIPREVAEADAAPLKPLVPVPIPYHGYLFRSLDYELPSKYAQKAEYKVDTGGEPSMGRVHNTSKFGFIAYPAVFGVTGKYSYLVNQDNSFFQKLEDGSSIRSMPSSDELFEKQ